MLKTYLQILGVIFIFSLKADAQDDSSSVYWPDKENRIIEWVGAYNNRVDTGFEPGLGDRIADLLFGKKQINLMNPFNLVVDAERRQWVLDQARHSLFCLDFEEGEITQYYPENDMRLKAPVGICLGDNKNMFISDSELNRVYRFNSEDKQFEEFAASHNFNRPTGLAFCNKNKTLWVVETKKHQLSQFDLQGNLLRSLGQRGTGPGQFNYPTFVWVDKTGMIYVIDSMNFRIQVFDIEGNFVMEFGDAGDSAGYFARPRGVATDSRGRIYIVDAIFNTVQVFDRRGQLLMHIGRQGRKMGEFWLPAGIYIDDNDHIFIADLYNSRIQEFKFVKGFSDEN